MAEEIDRVSEIFREKSVFISGATGFLGKVLVDKLLRVTEVKKLYLLIRQKKGKTPKDRIHDMFNHVLFGRLKQERPDSLKKCVVVSGDVTAVNLGISVEDREVLQNEVNFIFHSAATTRFDDSMKYAVQMNTRGTKYMLDLAKQCKNLLVFIHVSTAYAFPNEDVLYEKLYDPPADPNDVLNSINWIKDDTHNTQAGFAKKILGDCPNTYTFSKSLAEGLVNQEVGKLPVIIIRPSIVIPTWTEPLPGFFNNLQSPMGIFIGAGKGVIRTMYMDSKSNANFIPADSTINIMCVAAWDYLTTKKHNVVHASIPQEDLKLTWEYVIEMGKEIVRTRVPFNRIIWYPGGDMTNNRVWNQINIFLFQIIPALFIDGLLLCLGYKPILIAINQRLKKGQEMFEYYTTKAWDFKTDSLVSLRRRLNSEERQVYKIEADDVDIREYLVNCMFYARRHIFKETDDMLPAAKRNTKITPVCSRHFTAGGVTCPPCKLKGHTPRAP